MGMVVVVVGVSLLLDINFTQMCPRWASAHDWMSACTQSHIRRRRRQEEKSLVLAGDFIMASTLLAVLVADPGVK